MMVVHSTMQAMEAVSKHKAALYVCRKQSHWVPAKSSIAGVTGVEALG